MEDDKIKRADNLAFEIMKLSRNTLVINLRFLDNAICRFKWQKVQHDRILTDGQTIFYGVKYILKEYAREKESITRGYLHMVMHCIYRHMFVGAAIDHPV